MSTHNCFFPYVVISNYKMSDYKVINLHYLTILTNTLDETVDFCKQVNLIPKQVKCPNCSRILIKPYLVNRSKGDGQEIRYQCNRKMCIGRGIKNEVSLRERYLVWTMKTYIEEKSLYDILFCLSDVI